MNSVAVDVPGCALGERSALMVSDIADIEPRRWDSILSPSEIQMSHRFIRLVQESRVENALYRHVLIEDDRGPACIASLSFFTVDLGLLTSSGIRGPVSLLRRLWPAFLRVPVLFCGLPVSFGEPCLRLRRDADRSRCLDTVYSLMESVAIELGAEILCLKEFDEEEISDVAEMEKYGFLTASSLPGCRIDMRWPCFEAYLGDMRSGYRRQALASQDLARRSGLRARVVVDFGPWIDEIFRLYEQVMDRAEFQLERLNRGFFEGLNHRFASESRAILIEGDSGLLAAGILLDSGDTTAFLLAGMDYAEGLRKGAYPHLLTELVRDAVCRGARILEMGQTSYALKQRLGAAVSARYLLLRHRSAITNRLLRRGSTLLFPERKPQAKRVFK